MGSLKRVLWISDYFPRPHEMTTGVWALETVKEIQRQGLDVVVLSPTPYIPLWLAVTPTLRAWSNVPDQWQIESLTVFYPKCPHYPHRLVTKYLYNHLPFLDSSLIWLWCKGVVERLIEHYSFQVVHSNFIFPSGYIGLKIKQKYRIPLVVHERSFIRSAAALNHQSRRHIYARVVKGANAVITLNNKMAHLLKDLVPRDVHVITSAANIEIADRVIQQKPEKYKGKKIILSVGALIERKGHEYLIKAINYIKDEFPNIKCIIIGGGVRLRSLEKLINELSLNNIVELYGKRPHDEVLKTMSGCDVFVQPSWDEPFGTVYAEAMAFAKPIIACSGEGIGEVVQDGVQGLLVRKQNVESLAEALKKILSDECLASRLGRSAKVLVEEKLNYNFIAARIVDLYKQILTQG